MPGGIFLVLNVRGLDAVDSNDQFFPLCNRFEEEPLVRLDGAFVDRRQYFIGRVDIARKRFDGFEIRIEKMRFISDGK